MVYCRRISGRTACVELSLPARSVSPLHEQACSTHERARALQQWIGLIICEGAVKLARRASARQRQRENENPNIII